MPDEVKAEPDPEASLVDSLILTKEEWYQKFADMLHDAKCMKGRAESELYQEKFCEEIEKHIKKTSAVTRMLEALVVNEENCDRAKLVTLTKSMPQITAAHEKFLTHGRKFGFTTASIQPKPKARPKAKSRASR